MKQITNQDSVSAFSITLANATASVISFRMFDADGVVNAIQGARNVTATGTITPSVIYSTCVANPIVVSGFNYESSVKTAQFAPNIIAKAKRNTQFDSLLLTIDERFIIDSQTAVEVSVASTNDVTLTFFVEGFLS